MNWEEFKEQSNKKKCLDMWNWLAVNPGEFKRDFFVQFGLPAKILTNDASDYYCYACKDVLERSDVDPNHISCANCPVDWRNATTRLKTLDIRYHCNCKGNLFYDWRMEHDRLRLTKHTETDHTQAAAENIVIAIETTWKE